MSVEAIAVVLNHSKARGTEKLILIGIANHYGDNGAWPAVQTLARYSNMSERRVQQVIKSLSDSGELSVELGKGAGVGKYKTNRYWINVKCEENCTGFPQHSKTKPASPLESQTKPASLQDEARFALEVKPAMTKPIEEPLREPLTNEFDIFWVEYPKKIDKGAARKAFTIALKKTDSQTLIQSAKEYAQSTAQTEIKFIKNPATWLNAEAWANEVPKGGSSIWDQPTI